MKSRIIAVKQLAKALLICLTLVIFSGPATAENTFKIGYLEGGKYWLFTRTFDDTKTALKQKKWLDKITFADDAMYSPGWEAGETAWQKRAKELMTDDTLDLVIGMGTDATRALLAENTGKTPILGMGVSDAMKAGFIKSNTDSGIDNFTVRIVPGRYKRMFEIFHQVVGFKKLGLIYPDTQSGRNYTNLDNAREVAGEKGFKLVEHILDTEKTEDCLAGLKTLVKQGIDAFFVPSLLCFDWEKSDVDRLFDFLRKSNIPTFARNGSRDVKAGALMGFSTIDFSKRGQFLADRMIEILSGATPRKLIMKDDAVPTITLNIYVARQIGFDPPFDILAATDEIYQDVTLPRDRLVK